MHKIKQPSNIKAFFSTFIVSVITTLCLWRAELLFSLRYFSILYILLASVKPHFVPFILMLITPSLSFTQIHNNFLFVLCLYTFSALCFTCFSLHQTHFCLLLSFNLSSIICIAMDHFLYRLPFHPVFFIFLTSFVFATDQIVYPPANKNSPLEKKMALCQLCLLYLKIEVS